MFKRTIPLIITFVMGLVGMTIMFLQVHPFPFIEERLTKWIMIITAFSIFLGMVSLLKVNLLKIQKGHRDGFFSFVLLVAFFSTAGLGILGGVTADESVNATNEIKGGSGDAAFPHLYRMKEFPADATALTLGKTTLQAGVDFKARPLEGGAAELLFRGKPATGVYTVAASSGAAAKALVQSRRWNEPFRNKCYYLFTHMIKPMQSTMFSLLAFFVASAAFRAFRVKNFEATVLLIAAFLVMLGRVPIGAAIWSGFPTISAWIMDNINMPGSRAITFGTAIGSIAVSLKIMLGIERGYMGGE